MLHVHIRWGAFHLKHASVIHAVDNPYQETTMPMLIVWVCTCVRVPLQTKSPQGEPISISDKTRSPATSKEAEDTIMLYA